MRLAIAWACGYGIAIIARCNRAATRMHAVPSKATVSLSTGGAWRLTLRAGLHALGGWEAELERLTEDHQLISAETARRGGALELIFRCQLRKESDASALVASLNALPNVEFASAKAES